MKNAQITLSLTINKNSGEKPSLVINNSNGDVVRNLSSSTNSSEKPPKESIEVIRKIGEHNDEPVASDQTINSSTKVCIYIILL